MRTTGDVAVFHCLPGQSDILVRKRVPVYPCSTCIVRPRVPWYHMVLHSCDTRWALQPVRDQPSSSPARSVLLERRAAATIATATVWLPINPHHRCLRRERKTKTRISTASSLSPPRWVGASWRAFVRTLNLKARGRRWAKNRDETSGRVQQTTVCYVGASSSKKKLTILRNGRAQHIGLRLPIGA
jgi:hypothetical protein